MSEFRKTRNCVSDLVGDGNDQYAIHILVINGGFVMKRILDIGGYIK